MMLFAVLLLVPAAIALGAFLLTNGAVTWKEFGVQMAVQLVVAGIAAAIVHCQATSDTEVWNGVVASKSSEHVSCSHTYDCHPHSCSCDSKGRNCSTCYDTCHEHIYDVDWTVHTSNNEEISIDRVDRQGVVEPPRFTATKIGEPTTVAHDFVNYVKASPDSLFRHQGESAQYAGRLPAYPGRIYDYYRIDRLVLVGAQVPDAPAWNEALSELNGRWGAKRQANVIVVLARGLPQDYFYALEQQWIGAKKNDVVLVIGTDDALKPTWATVMCWTTRELFKVQLRDAVMALGPLTKENVLGAIEASIPSFQRKPMADFEYLEASITPSPLEWGITLALSILIALGLSYWFVTQDVFGDERSRGRSWR